MMTAQDRDRQMLAALVARTGMSLSAIARETGVAVTTLTRLANHKSEHRLSASTIDKLRSKYPQFFADPDGSDQMPGYTEIEVLPSFAGMGGGGYGDGEPGRALLPRNLIEEQLRGRAADFLMIEVRGDSMIEAGYFHGDQLLIDKRDKDPTQPGPFALYDGDAYVMKLVERIPSKRGWLRIFSSNQRYSPYEVVESEVQMIGRPVWLGRIL